MKMHNMFSPVNHGGVAGEHVDADAIAGFGISRSTESVQTLQHEEITMS